MLEKLKERVCEQNLQLVKYGLVVLTWGNVSALSEDGKYVVIKPSGVSYDNMKAGDMVVTDRAGHIVEGNLRPSTDLATHLALYDAFPGIGGAVHTHSRYAVAAAQAGLDLPCYGTTHADYFYGAVPCARELTAEEIEEAYERNTGLVIAETFRARGIDPLAVPAVLVKSHGPFTWGKTPKRPWKTRRRTRICCLMRLDSRRLCGAVSRRASGTRTPTDEITKKCVAMIRKSPAYFVGILPRTRSPPRTGPKPRETVIGLNFRTAPGGKGANQAVQCARLGADVTMVGRVGNDAYGRETVAAAAASGVDVSRVVVDAENPTGVSAITLEITETGAHNRIVVCPGANGAMTVEEISWIRDEVKNYDLVMLQFELPMFINEAVARWAHEAGVPVMVNPLPPRPFRRSSSAAPRSSPRTNTRLPRWRGIPSAWTMPARTRTICAPWRIFSAKRAWRISL